MKRLITFLGTGKYEETDYGIDEKQLKSSYVAHAIARMCNVEEVFVLATPKARDAHEQGLRKALSHISMKVREIPSGSTNKELWQQFEALRESLCDGQPDEVIVDITHGFRAQPFFAASVLALLRMSDALPDKVRVLYGEFRGGRESSPVWDITLFLELLDWAHGAAVLATTGQGESLVKVLRQHDRKQRCEIAQRDGGVFPDTHKLIGAIEGFTADLATVRIGSLVTGYEQDKPGESSAMKLLDAIEAYRGQAEEYLPALVPMLDPLKKMGEGIAAATLCDKVGQSAMLLLAQLYKRLGRYPEASTVVREGLISLHAGKEGCEIKDARFSDRSRAQAEKDWNQYDHDRVREISEVRNDMQHGGFRRQPLSADVLRDRVTGIIKRFDELDIPGLPKEPRHGKTWLVSRHEGALNWAREEAIEVDEHVEHLDVARIKAGDTVIGSLPVNLAADVCALGGHYLHLSLDLLPEWRGRELTVEQMRRHGARIEEYEIRTLGENL